MSNNLSDVDLLRAYTVAADGVDEMRDEILRRMAIGRNAFKDAFYGAKAEAFSQVSWTKDPERMITE